MRHDLDRDWERVSRGGVNLSDMERVKPLPAEFCVGCACNGCYPWSHNPALTCSRCGGLVPAFWEMEEDVAIRCLEYKPAFEIWDAYLKDRKKEAERKEQDRLKALRGEVIYSNNP